MKFPLARGIVQGCLVKVVWEVWPDTHLLKNAGHADSLIVTLNETR